jgi:hypothetical protein
MNADGLGDIVGALSDTVTRLGYGNVAEADLSETVLISLVTLKPADTEYDSDEEWLRDAVRGSMAVVVPTADEALYEASLGNLQKI